MAFYHSLGIKVSSLNMTLHCAFVGKDDVVSMLDFLVVFLVVCLHTKPGHCPLRFSEKNRPFSPFTSLLCEEMFVNTHYTRFKLVNLPPAGFQTRLLMYSLSPFTTPINLACFPFHSLLDS